MRPTLATHCGAGSSMRDLGGLAREAGEAGLKTLRSHRSALDAAIAATVVLEDDPRTNAGTGSRMRVDGSIQMDAGLMDSRLRIGAVAAISAVKNPILVARAVMDTPHILLAGEGAVRFARSRGLPRFNPATPGARERLEETLRRIRSGKVPPWARRWRNFTWDTVGAVARDSRGRFAAASSTGGHAYMMPGRVGDSPIVGCGFYAGPAGAVTVTGVGEEMARAVLSKHVYDLLEGGERASSACEAGLGLFRRSFPVGIIAVDDRGVGEACNRDMAWWASK